MVIHLYIAFLLFTFPIVMMLFGHVGVVIHYNLCPNVSSHSDEDNKMSEREQKFCVCLLLCFFCDTSVIYKNYSMVQYVILW